MWSVDCGEGEGVAEFTCFDLTQGLVRVRVSLLRLLQGFVWVSGNLFSLGFLGINAIDNFDTSV